MRYHYIAFTVLILMLITLVPYPLSAEVKQASVKMLLYEVYEEMDGSVEHLTYTIATLIIIDDKEIYYRGSKDLIHLYYEPSEDMLTVNLPYYTGTDYTISRELFFGIIGSYFLPMSLVEELPDLNRILLKVSYVIKGKINTSIFEIDFSALNFSFSIENIIFNGYDSIKVDISRTLHYGHTVEYTVNSIYRLDGVLLESGYTSVVYDEDGTYQYTSIVKIRLLAEGGLYQTEEIPNIVSSLDPQAPTNFTLPGNGNDSLPDNALQNSTSRNQQYMEINGEPIEFPTLYLGLSVIIAACIVLAIYLKKHNIGVKN